MPKIQMCRNGCGKYITVMEHENKWKPFDVSEDGDVLDLHNCPNSPYNKQQQGGGGGKFFQTQPTATKKSSFSIAMPSTESSSEATGEQAMKTKFSAAGETMDIKRIRVMLQEFDTAMQTVRNDIRLLHEKIEMNTHIDTNKLVGQLQQIYDFMAKHEPIPSTKTASELLQHQENDPGNEFEQMKKFTKGNYDEDGEDDTKGRATGGVED